MHAYIPLVAFDVSNRRVLEKNELSSLDVDPIVLAGIAVLNLMVDALLDFRAIAFPFLVRFRY